MLRPQNDHHEPSHVTYALYGILPTPSTQPLQAPARSTGHRDKRPGTGLASLDATVHGVNIAGDYRRRRAPARPVCLAWRRPDS